MILAAPTDVVVRDLKVRELRACQELQRRAWGITEDGYTLPVATMASAQRMGGLVLGAFRGYHLLGFSFAFLGRLRGEPLLYSQLTAVDPPAQGGGIGRLLKEAQRQRAAAMGLGSIAWTFDPLQASNAWFNLATLGANSRTYEVDLYGPRTDALNVGLATDRLLAEWPTRETAQGVRLRWSDTVDLVHSPPSGDAAIRRPTPIHTRGPSASIHAAIEIPANITALKAADPELAQTWLRTVRDAFQAAFAAGYVAVGFARGERPCYLLERRP